MSKILILGAGATQVPLIETAKKMGHETIVASIPGDYPGFKIADKVYYVNTTDKEGILDVAQKEVIDGICTTGTDVAVRSIGYVNTTLGLSGISFDSAKIVTDKSLMKERLMENGVRTARFYKACSVEEAKKYANQIGYPVMVKCTDQAASKGIIKVEKEEDIENAFSYALSGSRNSYVVVEKFLVGYEAGVDGYFSKSGSLVIPHGKMTYSTGATDVPSGHYIPFECSTVLYDDIVRQALLSCEACGLDKSFFNMDIMICDDGCYVIEIGGRTGATCIPDLLSIYTGSNYYEKIIRNCIGEKVVTSYTPQKSGVAELLMSDTDGILKCANVLECNSLEGVSCSLDVEIGDPIRQFKVGTDRYGQIIAEGRSLEDAKETISKARSILDVKVVDKEKAISIKRLSASEFESAVVYLKQIDRIFPTPMSSRVNIDTHAKKVFERGVVIAAKSFGKIVGILLGYANNFETKTAYLGTIGVTKQFRSLGIGEKLVEEFVRYSKEQKMQKMTCHAHKDNHRAIKFYERLQFVLTEDLNKPYEESVFLTKNI